MTLKILSLLQRCRGDDRGLQTLEWVIIGGVAAGLAIGAGAFADGRVDSWLEKIPL